MRSLASLFVFALALVNIASAQVTGNISGYARDASGAAVPGARVAAVMTELYEAARLGMIGKLIIGQLG